MGHMDWIWELKGCEQRGCGASQDSGCHKHEVMEFPLNDFNLRNGNGRAVSAAFHVYMIHVAKYF